MDWELIWRAFVVFMLLGIAGRMFFLRRELNEFRECFHAFESRIFPEGMVNPQTGEGVMRVLGLDEFIEEFGFDPRQSEDEALEANVAAVSEWDNAKN